LPAPSAAEAEYAIPALLDTQDADVVFIAGCEDNVVVPEDITPADGDETSPELRASDAANSTAISVRMRRG
jgi:hypothetical protein